MEGQAPNVIHVSMGQQHSPLEGTALWAPPCVQSKTQLRQNDACLLQAEQREWTPLHPSPTIHAFMNAQAERTGRGHAGPHRLYRK